jgi:hypothetical protein
MLDEREHIQHNLKIIREHLLSEFTGFKVTEDTADAPICHRFTMTDPMTYQQYRLKVGWRLRTKPAPQKGLATRLCMAMWFTKCARRRAIICIGRTTA